MNKKLDESFDLVPLEDTQAKYEVDLTVEDNEDDLEYAKENIKGLLTTGDDALKSLISLAKQTDSPRAFEVVAMLMKTMLEGNKDFVDIEVQKQKMIADGNGTTGPSTVNNNLILSTAEVLQTIKNEGKMKNDDDDDRNAG